VREEKVQTARVRDASISESAGTGADRGPVGVVEIDVEGLFGQFNYTLKNDAADLRDLLILYGDNGCGKTTILRILFHLLSPGKAAGHRTAIKAIQFKRFELGLADGTRICLKRRSPTDQPYQILIERPGKKAVELSFGAVEGREGRFDTPEGDVVFDSFVMAMGLTVYSLSANRRIESDAFPREEREAEQLMMFRMQEELVLRHGPKSMRSGNLADEQTQALLHALELASSWVRDQVLHAGNKGTSSSHGIYEEIVKHLLSNYPKDTQTERKKQVIETLSSLAKRTSQYSRFGFIPPLSVDGMINAVSQSTADTIGVIENVLTPYIKGTEARLKELQNIHALTEQFISNLDGFYRFKKVDFDLREGFTVRLNNGDPLNPALLSSGEKHLLLLFCHVLISNDKRSIFIIDEPELSLNIKWQRKLIGSLLQIIGSSDVQFILATHAIELLAEHDQNTIELVPAIYSPDSNTLDKVTTTTEEQSS
jgi:energy-coupling factor transporter ATP-binding protein EcfA2